MSYALINSPLILAQDDSESSQEDSTLEASPEPNPPRSTRPTIKLSPQVHSNQRLASVPTIPMDIIQHFLNHPKLITDEEIQTSGIIVADEDDSPLATKDSQIYVTGIDNDARPGNQYIIVRPGQVYRNPLIDEDEDDANILARESVYLGEAVLKVPGNPATLIITSAVREIVKGDLLLPASEQTFMDDLHPHSPSQLENAHVIAVVGDVTLVAQYQIVIINKGSDDGIEIGHVLAILKSSRPIEKSVTETTDEADDEEPLMLPAQKIGTLIIFRVFSKVSYALVLTSSAPIHLSDKVTIP
jgi:hypothetical protein